MSHYCTLVLAPAGTTIDTAEATVADMLAPYDENLEVEDHEDECPCLGEIAELAGVEAEYSPERVARREVLQQALAIVAERVDSETHRESAGEELPVRIARIQDVATRDGLAAQYEELDGAWTAFVDEANRAAEAARRAHPDFRKPNPDCESCGGGGRYRTSANPQGHWDWWEVGGRFTGSLRPDYEPAHDARNYSDCTLCDPETRKRYFRTEWHASRPEGLPGLFAREKDGMWEVNVPTGRDDPLAEESDCNGCHGTGVQRNFGNAPVVVDALPLSETPDDFPWGQTFHALVTPDGQWHQQGRVGTFATMQREIDAGDWVAYVKAEIAKHPETVGVVVDCHT
jgi:hypothetical protein